MATGRDIAKFATELTGDNYLALYDEGEAYDNGLKTEAQNKFKNMVNRMDEVQKNYQRDLID